MTDRLTREQIEALQSDMDDLQTWCTMLMANNNPVPKSRQAWDVIQRARAAIASLTAIRQPQNPPPETGQ